MLMKPSIEFISLENFIERIIQNQITITLHTLYDCLYFQLFLQILVMICTNASRSRIKIYFSMKDRSDI